MEMVVSGWYHTIENHFKIEKIELWPKRIYPFDSIRCVYMCFCCSSVVFFFSRVFFNATIDFDWSTICSNTYCPNACTGMMEKIVRKRKRESEIKEMRRRRFKTKLLSSTALIHSLLFSCLLLFLFNSMRTIFIYSQLERRSTEMIFSFSFTHTHTHTYICIHSHSFLETTQSVK